MSPERKKREKVKGEKVGEEKGHCPCAIIPHLHTSAHSGSQTSQYIQLPRHLSNLYTQAPFPFIISLNFLVDSAQNILTNSQLGKQTSYFTPAW